MDAPIGNMVNFPDLLDGVEAAPGVPRKSKKKNRSHGSTRKISDPSPASPAPSFPRSSKGSSYSVDFVDAVVVLPTSPPDKATKSERYHHTAKQGDETPSTNDSTRSNRSISNHGKVPNLLLPALSRGSKDTHSVMSSIDDERGHESPRSSDDGSIDATALLQMAKKRVGWQSLQEENVMLKQIISQKQAELGVVHGQLRQAVATKCDLVIENQTMEQQHEMDLFQHEEDIFRMQAANKYILEQYAETERELLNELIRLNDDLKHLEKKRQEELDDWERLHKNEIFNKNAEIAALRDQLHQAGLVPSTVSKPMRKKPINSIFGL